MPILTLPKFVAVNSAGTPYASAKLYTYRAGTTTNLDVYTTSALSVAHSNPVVADSNGLFPAIYIDPGSGYDLKIVLKTSADVELWTEDNIPRAESEFSTAAFNGSITCTSSITASSLIRTNLQLEIVAANPRIWIYESDQAADEKAWDFDLATKVFSLRTRTDADAAGKNAIVVTRGTGTAISSIAIGNATDNPTISFNGTAVITASTFTGTLTGMTATTTGTIHYKQTGKQVTLHVAAASSITGTSNSVAFSMTGLPAALYPAASQKVACIVQDNGNVRMGNASVGTDGTITFGMLGVSGSRVTTDEDFTNSGSKGLPPSWSMTYAL